MSFRREVGKTIRYFMGNTLANWYERGFYEGAKVTQANKDFYNATSPFEQTASVDRDTLRGRARWLSGNNAIMDNIDVAIINNTVGTGITLQSITDKESFNLMVEENFLEWATNPKLCDATKRFTFYDIQRLILKTRMVDGEIFIYKKITTDGLQLQLIEADAIDTSRNDGGIALDSTGCVSKYHFRDVNNKPFSIKAEFVINYFQATRASQVRGVSEYNSSILDIKNFSAFQTASIQSARARANIAYAIKQGGGVDGMYGDVSKKVQSINGVSVLYLDKGDDISKLDPDSVATDYVQFSENTIRLIATARKVSYELAFKDYSNVNFASSRASLLQDHKRFDHEQIHLTHYVLNDIFSTWLEVEILAGRIKAPQFFKNRKKWVKPKWIMPKRDLVDPLKEITAIEKKIKLNLTCETDVANSEGEDYEQILIKKQKEIKLKAKYGIPDYTLIEVKDDTTDDGKVDYDDNLTGDESNLDKDGNEK